MEMETMNEQTPMREIEIFGMPALFTEQAIPPDEEIPGMHYYELLNAEDGETLLGTVVTLAPVEIPEDGARDIFDGDLMLDTEGEMLTPGEFSEKYLSPAYLPVPDEQDEKAD